MSSQHSSDVEEPTYESFGNSGEEISSLIDIDNVLSPSAPRASKKPERLGEQKNKIKETTFNETLQLKRKVYTKFVYKNKVFTVGEVCRFY